MSGLPTNIEITSNIFKVLKNYLAKGTYSKIGVLVDNNTFIHCYPLIESSLPAHFTIDIASGEIHKDLNTCNGVWEEMTYHQMDRSSLLINLGGGVIGDMGGFCAATYKRGIDFLNIPTTLLAQVDASIGGKLGVDFQGFKNHIGIFKEPRKVIIDPKFLLTLPTAELKSGFAEVLKHALIFDAQYWTTLRSTPWEDQPWEQHIQHSINTKYQIVSQDPQENNIRKILNYGHTVGHAIERHYLHEPESLLHGEAIAIGMICEAFISSRKLGLTQNSVTEISEYLLRIFGKVDIHGDDINAIAKNTLQDKKNLNGRIICTLLEAIGTANYQTSISLPEIEESLEFYCSLDTNF